MPSHYSCLVGWGDICRKIKKDLGKLNKKKNIIVVDYYQGVDKQDCNNQLNSQLKPDLFIDAEEAMLSEDEIKKLVFPDVTNDAIFGFMTRLNIQNYFHPKKLASIQEKIRSASNGIIIITGIGAAYLAENWDLLIYVDMARWEIQQRMRRKEVNNIGIENKSAEFSHLYKQGFFVDWRVCDKHKKKLMKKWDYVLDTNTKSQPKMIEGKTLLTGLSITNSQPFSVVPFFDAGPWGGQWMKDVCDLDRTSDNYAWCFNCVPEENSLLLQFGNIQFETPSINLVFYEPESLLGAAVYSRFGDEFPIRFDFLDTMKGGNLSLQVHPLTEYIQENFGVHYTQDESYYIIDTEEDAIVYLGLVENVNPNQVIEDLTLAQKGKIVFDTNKHIQTWPVKKHDHLLIPNGTVHCSGKGSMVLEISATPYIFTFKLWDWERLGIDGKPRPINIEHGENVIDWSRTTLWTKENLVNRIEKVDEGDGWIEERTGLHEREFIETRRHWFSKPVSHNTLDGVNVLCLIEGEQAVIESPENAFEAFVVNYAETFIVPAKIGAYTIRPYGNSIGKEIATIKAYIRT